MTFNLRANSHYQRSTLQDNKRGLAPFAFGPTSAIVAALLR